LDLVTGIVAKSTVSDDWTDINLLLAYRLVSTINRTTFLGQYTTHEPWFYYVNYRFGDKSTT